jgi:Rrf2 family protein
MKLSHASSYAVHGVVGLATHPSGRLVPSHRVAHAEAVPEQFLLRVLTLLVRAGIVLATSGARGGFCLARPADRITLLAVVEAVDGPIRGTAGYPEEWGDRGVHQLVDALCQRIADQTRRRLGRVSIADLARKAK